MLAEEKRALRRRLLDVRMGIDVAEKQALDRALCERIAAHGRFLGADALLGFLPMRGEPDLTSLYRLAATQNIPVFLPRCTDNGMSFHLYTGKEELTPDRFGIPAPHQQSPLAAPTARTLCLLPGLAATKNGERLGYGGGFYDRFLPRFAGYTIFPLYSAFLLDTLPLAPHDCRADCIITEKGEV